MPVRRRIVFWVCCVNGLCAVAFGAFMMLPDPPLGLDLILPMMGNFPFQKLFFQTLFWSGLALLLWNGSMNLAATFAFLRKSSIAPRLSLIAGVMMVAWCAFEGAFLPNPAAVFYGAVGLVQVVLSWQIMRKGVKPSSAR